MKPTKVLFCATIGLSISSFLIPQKVFAAVDTAQQEKQMLIEMQQLQQEVNTLRTEITELQKQKSNVPHAQVSASETTIVNGKVHHHYSNVTQYEDHGASGVPSTTHGAQADQKIYHPAVAATSAGQRVPPNMQGERLTQGITVTTSPLLGLRSAYDASDLVVNISTMNEDLRLLQQRQKLVQQLQHSGTEPIWWDRPLIELSGSLEGQGVYQQPFQGNTIDTIDLTRAELDTLAYVSPYVLGLISMAYDNSPLPNNVQGAGQRYANSRFFLKRGFITLGRLSVSPFYFSLGQMYAPFGVYTSEMLDSPMTQVLGKTNQRMALLGFYEDGIYASGYVFNGDSAVANTGINDGGVNLGYKYTGSKFSADLGGGVLGNIADTLGFQETGATATAFQGFGFSSETERLHHRVPAVDAHVELDIAALTLLAEYVGATKTFDPNDLSYNNSGAQPRAMHFEGDYGFKMFERFPSIFTLAYDHSWEALPANIPKSSYIAELTTSLWKNTIEALEYRHDNNYSSNDVAGGNGFPSVHSSGGTQNTVMLQAGLYF